MKKTLVMMLALLAPLFFLSLTAASDSSSQDYKVIKKSAQDHARTGDATFLRVEIKNKKTGDATVKVRLPLALVENVIQCVPKEKLQKEGMPQLDIPAILKTLRDCKGQSLVEVEEQDQTIRIWIE